MNIYWFYWHWPCFILSHINNGSTPLKDCVFFYLEWPYWPYWHMLTMSSSKILFIWPEKILLSLASRNPHGFPGSTKLVPSILHCHQGSTSSAVGLVVNAIPFLYLWGCCACFTERPKVRSSKWYLPWPQHVEHVATCRNRTLQFDDAHLPTIVDTHTSGCLNWQAHHLRSFETQLLVPWTSHWLETLESFDGKPFPCESWIVPSVGARLSTGEHLGTRPMIAELHIPSWPTFDTLPE
jgi:hypothetical protein